MSKGKGRLTGRLMAMASAVFYSSKSPLIRYGLGFGATVPQLAALRMIFCALIFSLVSLLGAGKKVPAGFYFRPKLIAAALFFSLSVIFGFHAVANAGVALSVIVIYSHPVFVALFSRVFLGVKLGPARSVLLLTAYAGCAIIALSGGQSSPGMNLGFGIAVSLLSAALYAVYQLLIQDISARESSVQVAAAISYWSMLPAVAYWGFSPLAASSSVLAVALALGFFSTFIPMVLLVAAISRIGAADAAITSLVGPLVSVVAANLLFGEVLNAGQLFGGGLILLGVALLFLTGRK